jgi:ABC-2 type transport system permease protein
MNALALGIDRARYETRVYFRQGDTILFTFLFPVIMLTIFSVAFSSAGNYGTRPDGSGGISAAAFYLPGMIAAGILLSGVQNSNVSPAHRSRSCRTSSASSARCSPRRSCRSRS